MTRPTPQRGRTCSNCGMLPCHAHNLCGPCAVYQARNGRPRPVDMAGKVTRAGGRQGVVKATRQGKRCDCGGAAVSSVRCPAGKVFLCKRCEVVEREQAGL